jgi:hypothetical protein
MKKIFLALILILTLSLPVMAEEAKTTKWLNWTVELAVDGMYVPKLTRWTAGPSANLISIYNKVGIIGLTAQQVIGAKEDQPRSLFGPKASIDFIQAAREAGAAIPESLKFSLGLAVLFDQRQFGDFNKPYMAYFGTAFSYLFKDVPILE